MVLHCGRLVGDPKARCRERRPTQKGVAGNEKAWKPAVARSHIGRVLSRVAFRLGLGDWTGTLCTTGSREKFGPPLPIGQLQKISCVSFEGCKSLAALPVVPPSRLRRGYLTLPGVGTSPEPDGYERPD